MADDGRLHVIIDGDSSELQKALKDVTKSFDSTQEGAERLGGTIDGLKGKVAAFFSVAAAKSFLQKVYETRSYFQDIESSMKVFLGDAEKAADFTQKLKDYAYYNMFEFSDLAQASQQLIAYGNRVEDVIGIIDKLSNIATATKVPLMDMVALYNRAKNLGTVNSDGLASWASRGLVLTDVLRSMGEQVDGMSISFEQLNKALDKVTGEGGMFHGLMEEMMPNLSSSWGQLQDELSSMFNEIGEAMQQPMHDAIDLASSLVGNYKEIAETVAGLVVSYGAYRAALVTLNALKASSIMITKGWTVAEIAQFKAMGLVEKAQKSLNATLLKNPYTLAAAGVAAVAFGLYKLITAEKGAERAQRQHAEAMEEMSGRYEEAANAAKNYIGIVQDAEAQSGQRALAYSKLRELVPELTNLYSQEELAVISLTKAYGDLQKIQDSQKEAELKKAWEDSVESVRKYKDAMDAAEKAGNQYMFLRAKEGKEQAEAASKLAFDAYVKKSRENAIAYVPDQSAKGIEDSQAKRDKAYWEAVKKEAQAALDAMSDEELKSKKAAELKKKIADASKKIGEYSVSTDKGGSAGGDSKALDTVLSSARKAAASAEVSAIEDEGARTLAALRLKHRNEIEELKRQKAELERLAAESGVALSTDFFDKTISDTAKRQAREYRAAFEKYAIKELPKLDNPATSGNKGLAGFGDLTETKKTLEEIAAQYSIIFADADSLSQDQLREAIRLTTEEIKKAAPGTQEYISLLERLRAQLDTQISNRGWGFSKIIDAFRNLPKAVSEYNTALDNNDEGAASKAEGEVQAYVQAVKDGMSQVSSAFSGLGSSLEKFGGKIGEVGGLLSGLASNTDNITTAFTSKNKGEIISAGISSAVQYVGMIGDQIAENKRIEEEWNATIRETAHELDMLNLEKLDYKQENLFGVENPYKRAIDGARQYGEAVGLINSKLGELAEGQVQVGTNKVANWKNVGQGAALGAGVGAAAGSVIPAIGTAIGAAIGTVAGALGGLFGGKKKVAVYENLLDKYGSLLDESEGAGPFDLNPKIIADYKKLDDATKQIVDNWDEIKKKAEEAEEQMRQNFSDLAGDIGDQLSDALVDAFRNGDLYSAVDDFHGKMTSTIEDIVSQLVFSAVFKDLFNELEKRFNDSFKAGGDQSITDDLIWFDKIYKGNLDKYKEAMDQAKAELEGQGYDAWSSDTRTGTSKGIANASQDSVDELNGRATAIQGYTYNIQENTSALVRHSASMLEHLSGIRDNTARLEAIEKIARDIRDHGVKAL
nr:MAG TPA: tail tape measure protein [Bacteriophage sp.]